MKTDFKIKFNPVEWIREAKFGDIPAKEMLVKIGYYLFLMILIPLLFPSERSFKYTDVTVGSITNKKVIAPFTFSVLKTRKELEAERKKAADEVLPVFVQYDSIASEHIDRLKSFLAATRRFRIDSTISPDSVTNFIQDLSYRVNISFTERDVEKLHEEMRRNKNLQNILTSAFTRLYSRNFINVPLNSVTKDKITVIRNGIEEEVPAADCIDQPDFLSVFWPSLPNRQLNTGMV